MTRPTCAALVALCACTTSNLGNPAELATAPPGTAIEGEFVIESDIDGQVLSDLGLAKVDFDDGLGFGLYRTDRPVSLTAMRTQLGQHLPSTVTVEQNLHTAALATDPYRAYQWNLDMLDIETAWARSTGEGAVVAVIDTGVSRAGEDTPASILPGWDFVDNDSDPTDENGHGTHVAGTIAQATGNGRGVAGVAPDATILPLRVLNRNGTGSVYWSAKAIRYAADEGADVINLSLGSPSSSSIERSAVNYAVGAGVVVVAASGNDGKGTVDYPGAYDGVIAVGAIGGGKQVAPYSNRGSSLDVVAPGGDMGRDLTGDGYADGILQETLGGYQFFEGTSMATPHVAAAAALLIGAGADPGDVEHLLTSTATDLGSPGWDSASGYGLIDPVAALDALGSDPQPGGDSGGPAADTTPPEISDVSSSRNGQNMTVSWTTSEPASSELEFTGYGQFGDPDALLTEHELRFTVDAQATYYVTVIAVDAAGNRAQSGEWTLSP